MSEDIKIALYQELKRIDANLVAAPDIQMNGARSKESITSISRVIVRAKEHLDPQEYEAFLQEVNISSDIAKGLVEDLYDDRHWSTQLKPLAERLPIILRQLNIVCSLLVNNDLPHYRRMFVGLRNEAYEVAKELDNRGKASEERKEAHGLLPLPTFTQTIDMYLEHIRKSGEYKEYRCKIKEKMLFNLSVLSLINEDEEQEQEDE